MKLYRIPKGYALEISFENRGLAKSAGFEWDGNAKRWWTPSQSAALKFTDCANPELKAELLEARKKTEAALAASYAGDADFDPPCPEGFSFYPFQKAGIFYGITKMQQKGGTPSHGVLIADEMGLGKTCQAIGIINCLPDVWQVLIVCPASLRINWMREWERVRVETVNAEGRLRCATGIGIAQGRSFFPDTAVVICNFDILKSHLETIHARKWDAVIVDEAHYIKGGSQRSKALMSVKADYRIALTGTPILNKPIEIFNVLKWLRPDVWSNKFRFAQRYCDLKQSRFGMEMKGATNLEELQAELRANVMCRRRKADVLKELPPKTYQVIELPADGVEADIQNEWAAYTAKEQVLLKLRVAQQLAKASDSDDEYRKSVEALKEGVSAAFAEMAIERKRIGVKKIPFAVEHLKDIASPENPVVAFTYHHEVFDGIAEHFKGQWVGFDGRIISTQKRQNTVDIFQQGRTPLFLGGMQAAGVGITLTVSNVACHVEEDWTPAILDQCADRLHRIGQRRGVLVQYLVFEGSLGSVMMKRTVEKQKIIDAALNDEVGVEHLQDVEVAAVEDSDEPATAEVTRKQVVAEAVRLLPEDVAFIHATLQIVAGMDSDYAHSKNAMGFNKVDSEIGHSLAKARRLTPKMAVLALKLCHRYRGQLPAEIAEELEKIQGNCG